MSRRFIKIAEGIDVAPIVSQLEEHPELWEQYGARRTVGSPHADAPDIWVRWRAQEELTAPRAYAEPHFAVFYPAWHALPALHPVIYGIMAHVRAVYLGGIFITKIPPGKAVLPHHDRGGWHPETMNCKVYVPLKANDRCVNFCGEESVTMKAGECWSFDNLVEHSVVNNGGSERWTLISCMRVEH